jgi:hypothetical protein
MRHPNAPGLPRTPFTFASCEGTYPPPLRAMPVLVAPPPTSRFRSSVPSLPRCDGTEGAEAGALGAGKDVVGRLDSVDGLGGHWWQSGDGAVSTTAERTISQQAEPALGLVDPGGRGRRDVDVGLHQDPENHAVLLLRLPEISSSSPLIRRDSFSRCQVSPEQSRLRCSSAAELRPNLGISDECSLE